MNAGPGSRFGALLIAGATLVLAGGLAMVLLGRAAGPVDPETTALRIASEGALRSLFADVVPPATYSGGPLPPSTAAEMRARVMADFGRYLTDRLRARYQPMILDAIAQIGASEWDAEVNQQFDWGDSTVVGDRSTVHATETESIVRRGGQFGTNPTDSHRLDTTGDWTLSLARTDGVWRVDEIDLHCRTGCP